MHKYETLYIALSVICFTIVLGIYENILSLVTISNNSNQLWWFKTIVAIGIFALLFQFLMWISKTIIKKYFSYESKIIGEWYQIFKIHNHDSNEINDIIRHGPVTISFNGQLLEIIATNLKTDNLIESSSSWHSNKITIDGNQVWLLYSSTSPGRETTHGNMLYHFQGNTHIPKKLIGQFSDSSPAKYFGSIELFRNKSDYEERLKDFLK